MAKLEIELGGCYGGDPAGPQQERMQLVEMTAEHVRVRDLNGDERSLPRATFLMWAAARYTHLNPEVAPTPWQTVSEAA